MSALFRQKQSQYLRRLQGMEVDERKADVALLDNELLREDMEFVCCA